MADNFKEDSPSVQAHLSIMQSVINRMASNSTSCKAWCISLVSAILVIVADKGKPQLALIALIPTILFCSLDAYYLVLEKRFRESYRLFIEKLHSGTLVAADLYFVSPSGDKVKASCDALRSYSVWGFYVALLVMIFLVKMIVIAPPPPAASDGASVSPASKPPTSSSTR
jgi:hypothetical protein